MMVNQRCILTFTLLGAVTIAVAVVVPTVLRRNVAAHQRNVIREFDAWGGEYSQISDRESAVRAAGMIDYISTYYLPGDGYRSDEETEQRLKDVRRRTINRIADALSVYTGTSVTDPLDWGSEICDSTRQIEGGE